MQTLYYYYYVLSTFLQNYVANKYFLLLRFNLKRVILLKVNVTRQHRKALWHNGCPSHNLLWRVTLAHDLDIKRGEGMQEWKT